MTKVITTDLSVFEGPLEEPEECRQTEPVHVVDLTQVFDDEVKSTPILGQR